MVYFGLALIVIGIVWYIVHTIIYNHYLAKNAPELLQPRSNKSRSKGKKQEPVTVIVTEGQTPGWLGLLGIPPIPIFLLGLLITIVSAIVGIFT